jgi:Domain of unknown function (DUF4340)
MRKGWWLNIALLGVVAGLGLYAYFKPGTQEPVQHAISALSPAQVQKLVIERSGDTIELVKKDNLWSLTSPMAARADASQVNRMLDILSVKSKEKLAATDLARFDLDKPETTLRFGEHALSFGTTNSLTQDQYVLSDGGVYLIPSYYAQQVPSKPDRLLTHSLFAEGEKPVAFELSGIAAEQKDGKWQVTRRQSKEGELSQDDLNRWTDDWRLSSSLLTQPYSGKPGIEQIRVKLANGKTLALEVLQKEPDLILARTDENLQFQYSTEAGKRLLEPKPEPLPASEPPSAATEKK